MDYTTQVLEAHYTLVSNFNKSILETMEVETDIIMQCMETSEVIFEAVETKKSIFTTVLDFLKRIRDAFLEKLAKLTDFSGRWIKSNLETLQKLNYSGVSVDVLPYWNIDTSKMTAEAKKISNTVFNALEKPKVDNVEQAFFKTYGGGTDTPMADNFKQYFRFGSINKNIKPVTLKDDALKSKVLNEFVPYCQKYNTTFAQPIRQLVGDAERNLKQLDSSIKKQSKKEQVSESSFIVLGGATLKDMGIVVEAEKPEVKVEPKPESKDKDTSTKPKVVVTRANSTQDKSVSDLKYMRQLVQINQLAMASLMTVAEERYSAYWTIIKQVHASSKGNEIKKQD